MKKLIEKYNYFFFDLWGVIYDGKKIDNNINKILKYIHKNKKKVVIVTNSSKTRKETIKFLKKIGLNLKYINHIFTSGEFAKKSIKNLNKEAYLIDKNNTQKSRFMKSLGIRPTNNIKNARYALAISATMSDDINVISKKIKLCFKNNMKLICINSDLHLINFSKGMGFYLNDYINLGGSFRYFGKPNKDYYNFIIKKLKIQHKKDILFIGDTIYNDIVGANNIGIDTLLIKKSKLYKLKIKKFNIIKLVKKNILLPKYEMDQLNINYNFSRNY